MTETFGEQVTDIALHRESVEMPAESPSGWVDYMATAYGPLVRAQTTLEARGAWEPLRSRLSEIASHHSAGNDDQFAGRADYLTAVLCR